MYCVPGFESETARIQIGPNFRILIHFHSESLYTIEHLKVSNNILRLACVFFHIFLLCNLFVVG